MTAAASLKALDAFCSPEIISNFFLFDFIQNLPSAAITFALASRVASASAAMALCNWTGSRTSLL